MADIRIVLVHPERLLVEAVVDHLERQPRARVVGTASTAAEAVALVDRCRPDVVIIGDEIPGVGGYALARLLWEIHPLRRVLVLGPGCGWLEVHVAADARPTVVLLEPPGIADIVAALGPRRVRRTRSVEGGRRPPPAG